MTPRVDAMWTRVLDPNDRTAFDTVVEEAIRAAVEAERAAIVKWLRSERWVADWRQAADAIERGEHRDC